MSIGCYGFVLPSIFLVDALNAVLVIALPTMGLKARHSLSAGGSPTRLGDIRNLYSTL